MSLLKNLSLKTLYFKQLNESKEPFFHLAPDVVGSINNAYTQKNKKVLVIDFNTVDERNPKLAVPYSCYKNWKQSNEDGSIKGFLNKFLETIEFLGNKEEGKKYGSIDEMVDEFGEVYDLDDDLPANTTGAPGYSQHKDSSSGQKQYTTQLARVGSSIGYGGIVW